jgi:serine/threonine protein kinase
VPDRTCPSTEQLSAFVLGTLSETQLTDVGRHLDGCPDCEEAVASLEQHGDDVIVGLRGTAASAGIGAETTESRPPSQLGDFRIVREVGRGGMGIVYEAVQLSLGRRVAVKVLPRHFLLGPDAVERFRREARAAARLHHTNIVQIFGTGEQDGLHYFVMQYIAGEGLDSIIYRLKREQEKPATATASEGTAHNRQDPTSAVKRISALAAGAGTAMSPGSEPDGVKPTPVSQSGFWPGVARIGLQVAEALAFAHAEGVLHRDVKPSNLLLDPEGRAWLADFGLAKESADTGDLTASGYLIGTLRYVPPERFEGHSDARGDVYGLGITLYELLTLSPAFTAYERSELLHQILHAEPPRPRKLNAAVPRDLETIVLKAMDRDPAHRYQSAAALAGDLRLFLDDRPIKARRASEAEKLWRWCRRNPAPALLATAFLGAVLVGSSGIAWKWWEAEQRRQEADARFQEAEAARQRETEARQQADASFRAALSAVDEFFTEISENKELLKKQPRTQALRRRLLEKAQRYYEGFLSERGDDPNVRVEAASAHYRLGEISNILAPGSPKTVEQYERGVAVIEPLMHDRPDDPRLLLLRAEILCGLARAVTRADRYEEGLASLDKARQDMEKLVMSHPGQAQYANCLARAYITTAYVHGQAGRTAAALAANDRAAEIGERLVREFPEEADYAERLAITYLNMGADRKASGDYREALKSVSRARAIAEALVAKNPGQAVYLQVLLFSLNNAGYYQTALNLRAEALATLTRGAETAERVLRDEPGVPDHRYALAYTNYNLGALQLQEGDRDGAQRSLTRAHETDEQLSAENPSVHRYADLGARVAFSLGWARHAAGNDSEAAAAFARCLAIGEKVARANAENLRPASMAAWLLADSPLPALRDPARALALARQCLQKDAHAAMNLLVYGLALLRSGEAKEAIGPLAETLQKLSDADQERPCVEMALVLAYWQSGQKEPARELFVQATARLNKSGWKHPEYQALRAEAAALLRMGQEVGGPRTSQ